MGLILPAPTSSVAPIVAPAGTVSLREHVRPRANASQHFVAVLDALFGRTVVADTWESAIDVAVAHPELVVVTRDGDRFAGNGWRVASGRALVTRTSVEEAEAAATDAQGKVAPATEALRLADNALRAAREAHQAAQLAQVKATNEVERLRRDLSRCETELIEIAATVERFSGQAAESSVALEQLERELAEETARVPQLEAAAADADQRAKWAAEAKATLDAEREAVADLRRDIARRESSVATRRQVNSDRLAEVERRLAGHAAEREVAAERRRRLEFELDALSRLETIVEIAADDVRTNQAALESTYREQLEASRASAERLEDIRRRRATVDAELTESLETMRRADIELAELTVKLSTLAEAVQRDLHGEWDSLDGPVDIELPEGVTLEQRLAELEARLSSLGPINPLALEELTALEERYRDLDAQVADVRHARRELQEAIRALDDEIMATFTAAFADVNEHFSSLIAMLFPGGQGRLSLTEPDDPLNTGVEIEVRPMGRNVRRVSLLSGGERSMAALAFLFSTFRSRPSPFYMMDEVEAALDDVNLQRFLSLVAEFRDEAQLLIVTHQKRTMEAADALYGVTMVPGGSSKVVSQRVTGKLAVGSE
jgi:chromosome segregation protein